MLIVVIHRFPRSLMCGDCMPQFHVRVLLSIYNPWELEEFKTTWKLVFNLFLVFSVQTNPPPQKKTVTFDCK